jgi:arylsulfatase A-like enzyme
MHDLTRRALLKGISGAAASWLVPGCAAPPAGPPNLLLLVADDQRWDTLGCCGNPVVQTPHLDALARRGTLFTNAFVTTSICPASRASILTGLRAGHHGVFGFDASVPPEQMAQSYPARLRAQGYETAFIGKWGVDANRREPLAEAARYFDYWAGASFHDNYWHEARCRYVVANGRAGATDNECDCPPDAAGTAGARPRAGHANQREPLHLTTQIVPRRFQDFLDTRDVARPFCASISFKAPHVPSQDFDPRFAALYRGDEIPLRASVALAPDPALPPPLRESLSGAREALGGEDGIRDELRNVYRHVTGLDFAVGEMLRALAERELDGNTVVLFTSDNGRLMGEHGLWGKWLMYEESIRVPFLIHDPRLRWPARRERSDAMVLNVDVAPTLCELGGAPPAGGLDGTSLVPLLRGDADSVRDDWFYEHRYRTRREPIARSEGIRGARWKYVCLVDEEPMRELLFDLAADPYETRDLAQAPGHEATLLALRARWQAEGGGMRRTGKPRRAAR